MYIYIYDYTCICDYICVFLLICSFNHLQQSSTIFNQLDLLKIWVIFLGHGSGCDPSHQGDDRSEGLGHVSHGFQDAPGTSSYLRRKGPN